MKTPTETAVGQEEPVDAPVLGEGKGGLRKDTCSDKPIQGKIKEYPPYGVGPRRNMGQTQNKKKDSQLSNGHKSAQSDAKSARDQKRPESKRQLVRKGLARRKT